MYHSFNKFSQDLEEKGNERITEVSDGAVFLAEGIVYAKATRCEQGCVGSSTVGRDVDASHTAF